MKVLAIDIGYHNMGLVLTEFEDSPKIDVKYMKKVSLEDYKYLRSNDFVDLIPLFVEDHQDIFDSADKILIERQPPGGFTNIEILLNYMFKDKVVLISPVSMHMHFGMRHLDYEERKERTVRLAEKYMDYEIPYERKHDIADAFCMIVYYNFKVTTHIFDKFRFKDKETQDNMILTFSDKEKNDKVKSRPPGQIFVLDNIFSDDACLKMVEYIKNNVDTESKKNQTDINVRADSIILNKNQKWYEIISTTLSNVGMNIADKYYIGVCTMSNRGISDNISLRRIYGATKWHIDGPVSDTSNENARFQVKQQRCMSVVAALNSDYDGGELIFPCQDIKVKLKKGQVILFPPSWTHPHYTEELRNGTFRYTINTWLSI